MPNFETSFIPDQGTTYQGGSRRSAPAAIFSIVIVLAACAFTAYAWWLQREESNKVKNLEAQLSSMESQFDISKITQLGVLDKKIEFAQGMLNKHPLPSMIIDYLAENTVASIKWKQINYTRNGETANAGDTKAKGDSIDLVGESIGYSPLYQQLNHFRTRSHEITSVQLKSFSIDPRTNLLAISMTIIINPNYATVATMRAKNALNEAMNSNQAVPGTGDNSVQPIQNIPTPQVVNTVTSSTTVKNQTPPIKQNTGTSSKPVVTGTNQ